MVLPGRPGRRAVGPGQLQQPAESGDFEVFWLGHLDVAQHLPWALQQTLRVWQFRALVEAQVDVVGMEGDVAEVFAHLLRADTVASHVLSRPWYLDYVRIHVDNEGPRARRQIAHAGIEGRRHLL